MSRPPVESLCVNGRAGFFPCRNIDLAAFVPHSELNNARASDIWGWADPKTKREYALMGTTRGLIFVDVTKPTKPVFLGQMPKAENLLIWQDVEVYKDHASHDRHQPGDGLRVPERGPRQHR